MGDKIFHIDLTDLKILVQTWFYIKVLEFQNILIMEV